jgi:hypothetical protein
MGERCRLFVPKQAVGANLVYFDLFNASTSGVTVLVHRLQPVVSGAAAHTGVLSVDLFLTFTTAIGTGGTAATVKGTALDAMTFAGSSSRDAATPTGVTGRLTPTGGGTAGKVISWLSPFTEETNAGTYIDLDFVKEMTDGPVVIHPGAGIRVVQGAVASTGNVGFQGALEFVPFF